MIIRKDDRFAEFYLIETGYVMLSLRQKWQHDYFKLPNQTCFGDYQILLDLKARECYTTGHKETRTMCIKKGIFKGLLEKYPLIKDYYVERAKQRRVEFRRIKRIYLEEQGLASESEEDDRS